VSADPGPYRLRSTTSPLL